MDYEVQGVKPRGKLKTSGDVVEKTVKPNN